MKRKRIDTSGKPWARYLRLSKAEAVNDRNLSKEQRLALTVAKLDDHKIELTRWMDANGIPYSDDLVFMDPGLSAWKPNVKRPDWDRMMELAERGEIAGIGIVAVDRFTRDVTTMEDLIKLAESTDVKIGGPRAGRLDLTTYEGIQQARGMAMQAANESLATSFRIKERLGTKMRNGKPMGGGRPFGWEIGGQVQRPAEVEIVREIVTRHLAKESWQSLADDLNARGVTTVRGGKWTPSNLTRMLSSPRYGGLIERDGETLGKITNPDGSAQEPILDRDTYDELQTVLASRRRGRRPSGQFLLTGVLLCGECQRPMNGASRQKPANDGSRMRVYRCPPQLGGCGRSIRAEPVEQMVDRHMIALLSQPEHAAKIIAESNQLNDARTEQQRVLGGIEDQIDDLGIKWANGDVPQHTYDRMMSILSVRWKKASAKLDELPRVAMDGYDAEADWRDPDMTDDQRRQIIKRYHVKIEIGPYNGARRFDPNRVRIS